MVTVREAEKEVVSQLILWEPSHGKKGRGRPANINQIEEDTGIPKQNLGNVLEDHEQWNAIINSVRSRSMR